MSTRNHSLKQELTDCNACLDARLRNIGMTVKTYKAIKATTQLAAVGVGFYAISKGADPTLTFALVASIVVGPDAVETIIAESATQKD